MKDWESFWKDVLQGDSERRVFWDSGGERAALEDLARFQDFMDPRLPLLDMGCGNGQHTRCFSQYFERVIGVDISPSAIDLARKESEGYKNINFRLFDGVDSSQARRLNADLGEMNVYMRGVFHMIRWKDRPTFVNNLALLLGQVGTLYLIELPPEAILQLRQLPTEVFHQIPKITRRVGFSLEESWRFFPEDQWMILNQGRDAGIQSNLIPDGVGYTLQAVFMVLRRTCALTI